MLCGSQGAWDLEVWWTSGVGWVVGFGGVVDFGGGVGGGLWRCGATGSVETLVLAVLMGGGGGKKGGEEGCRREGGRREGGGKREGGGREGEEGEGEKGGPCPWHQVAWLYPLSLLTPGCIEWRGMESTLCGMGTWSQGQGRGRAWPHPSRSSDPPSTTSPSAAEGGPPQPTH